MPQQVFVRPPSHSQISLISKRKSNEYLIRYANIDVFGFPTFHTFARNPVSINLVYVAIYS